MYLAIDIGATKTLVALFSKRGRVLRRRKFKTAQGSKTFLNNLMDNLESFKKFKVRSVIVAIPGIVQKDYTVNFGNRNWDNIDIYTPIKNLFKCPIYFENDANLATVYEAHGISGRVVFLTFSTGIGGGVADNGRLLENVNFEPGHRRYGYGGKTKEWEDLAAASAIGKYYHVDAATSLRDKTALKDIAARIYLGLPDIAQELHPRVIILGGPMGKIFRLYNKYLPTLPDIKYQRPKRPLESVIYGCYLYAKQRERE